jgi:hypothetical protein
MEDSEIIKKTADGFESTGMYTIPAQMAIDQAIVTVGDMAAVEADA